MCLLIEYEDQVDLGSGFRKARKLHNCMECGREIQSGESYFYQTSVMDGSHVYTWKMCAHCRATITLASQMTDCPETWYWEMAIGTDEETHTGDALTHDLPSGGRVALLRCIVSKRRKWRATSGGLVDVPR